MEAKEQRTKPMNHFLARLAFHAARGRRVVSAMTHYAKP